MMVHFKLLMVKYALMPVNDGEMCVWSYAHFTIIDEHFSIIRSFDHHCEAAPTAMIEKSEKKTKDW